MNTHIMADRIHELALTSTAERVSLYGTGQPTLMFKSTSVHRRLTTNTALFYGNTQRGSSQIDYYKAYELV